MRPDIRANEPAAATSPSGGNISPAAVTGDVVGCRVSVREVWTGIDRPPIDAHLEMEVLAGRAAGGPLEPQHVSGRDHGPVRNGEAPQRASRRRQCGKQAWDSGNDACEARCAPE